MGIRANQLPSQGSLGAAPFVLSLIPWFWCFLSLSENLIYLSPADDSAIKITDFGLAKYRSGVGAKSDEMTTACGTPGALRNAHARRWQRLGSVTRACRGGSGPARSSWSMITTLSFRMHPHRRLRSLALSVSFLRLRRSGGSEERAVRQGGRPVVARRHPIHPAVRIPTILS